MYDRRRIRAPDRGTNRETAPRASSARITYKSITLNRENWNRQAPIGALFVVYGHDRVRQLDWLPPYPSAKNGGRCKDLTTTEVSQENTTISARLIGSIMNAIVPVANRIGHAVFLA